MVAERMSYIIILVGLCILMVGIITSMAEPEIDNATVETPPVIIETPIEENEEPVLEEEYPPSEMQIREGEIREEEALQDEEELLEEGTIEEPYMGDELLEDVDEEPVSEIQEDVITVIPDDDNSDNPEPQTEVKKAVSAPVHVTEKQKPATVKPVSSGEKKKVWVRGKVNKDGYVWVGTKYAYESVTVIID